MNHDEIALADMIWEQFKKYIPNKDHKKLARWMFDLFRNRSAYNDYKGERTQLEKDGGINES